MIRSLVVAYDGSHGARVALQYAVDIADRGEGRICLLTVSGIEENIAALLQQDSPNPVALAAEPHPPDEELPLASETDAALVEAIELCRKLTVRSLARPAYGSVVGALVRASHLSDLLLLGRDALPSAEMRTPRTARHVAQQAYCPVVVTPRQYISWRSVLAVCPADTQKGAPLRVASELASLMQLKLEALVIAEETDVTRRWIRDVNRYLVDHGHTPQVTLRRPPIREQLVALLGERQSPLIVVPRASRWAALWHQDYLSAAMEILNATIVVVP
ncbi:MAG: universal stress protein [Candidatus Zipacnadales bacterium]